jgi:hypothetical protein
MSWHETLGPSDTRCCEITPTSFIGDDMRWFVCGSIGEISPWLQTVGVLVKVWSKMPKFGCFQAQNRYLVAWVTLDLQMVLGQPQIFIGPLDDRCRWIINITDKGFGSDWEEKSKSLDQCLHRWAARANQHITLLLNRSKWMKSEVVSAPLTSVFCL